MSAREEVVSAFDQMIGEVRQEAIKSLSLAAAHLGVMVETLRSMPDDTDTLDAAVKAYAAHAGIGWESFNLMNNLIHDANAYRASDAERTVAPPALPPERPAIPPLSRAMKLDAIGAAMIQTASGASADLDMLRAVLAQGGTGDPHEIVAAMNSFAAHAEQLKSYFVQAAEVATCHGSG